MICPGNYENVWLTDDATTLAPVITVPLLTDDATILAPVITVYRC